jgi:hypothetical protein
MSTRAEHTYSLRKTLMHRRPPAVGIEAKVIGVQVCRRWPSVHLLLAQRKTPWVQNRTPASLYADGFPSVVGTVQLFTDTTLWQRCRYANGPTDITATLRASSWRINRTWRYANCRSVGTARARVDTWDTCLRSRSSARPTAWPSS